MESKFETHPLVLLAGGKSTRMGIPKGLLEYNNAPWLLEQLHQFSACGGKQTILVLGYRYRDYLESIPWLIKAYKKWREYKKLQVAVLINEAPHYGPFSSIQYSGRWLKNIGPAGVFILPIDVPCPGKKVWSALTNVLDGNIEVCVPQWKKRGGHPVLLSCRFLNMLLSVPVDSLSARLDVQIQSLPKNKVAKIQVYDRKISMNLNKPSDWEKFQISSGCWELF